jgi:hypothetical protein
MPATRLADPPVVLHVPHGVDTPVDAAQLADTVPLLIGNIWSPQFPSPEKLQLAAQKFDARPAWQGEEGPRHRLVLSAGSFRVSAPDLARRERTAERAVNARRNAADQVSLHLASHEHDAEIFERCAKCPTDPEPSREVTEFSAKSRANMVAALCELDYRPLLNDPTRVPAMVTLTYPGDWFTVAPDGRTAKRHLQAFRKRYVKAWGDDLYAVWKLEFQDRGAPHFHLLMVPPHGRARIPKARARKAAWVGAGQTFKQWLSAIWADIVDHPDPREKQAHLGAGTNISYSEGLRASDPKRVSVYFTKHGSFRKKEYQHRVPAPWQAPGKGPGRFWGYWGLHRVTLAVEVTPEQATQAARIARRWARAQGTTREVIVPRTRGGAIRSEFAEVEGLAGADTVAARTTRRRSVRRRVVRLKNGRGFVSVNDGTVFAEQLAQALAIFQPAPLLVDGEPCDPPDSRGTKQPHGDTDCTVCGEAMELSVAYLGHHMGCDPVTARRWARKPWIT